MRGIYEAHSSLSSNLVILGEGAFETVVGRHIYNVHERLFDASTAKLTPVFDSIGQPGNLVWPATMVGEQSFDRPFGVGAVGGHNGGLVSYTVADYCPGRRIMFRFNDVTGYEGQIVGIHYIEMEAAPDERSTMRYVLTAEMVEPLKSFWVSSLGRLRDRAVELLFDNVERALAK